MSQCKQKYQARGGPATCNQPAGHSGRHFGFVDQPTTTPDSNPPPTTTPESQPVVPALVKLIHERRAKGISTYGSELHTHNGRDALIDALEESVDLNQYLTQALMEEREHRRFNDANTHRFIDEQTAGLKKRAEAAESRVAQAEAETTKQGRRALEAEARARELDHFNLGLAQESHEARAEVERLKAENIAWQGEHTVLKMQFGDLSVELAESERVRGLLREALEVLLFDVSPVSNQGTKDLVNAALAAAATLRSKASQGAG